MNTVEFDEEIAGLTPRSDMYVVANVTIKNITDETFDATAILHPSFGPEGEREVFLNDVLLEHPESIADDNLNILEGEIAPSEEMTGDFVFCSYEGELYRLFMGGHATNHVTHAIWELEADSIEFQE